MDNWNKNRRYFFSAQERTVSNTDKPSLPLVCTRDWFKNNTRPIYLYGAGLIGDMAISFFRFCGESRHIRGFLDGNPSKIKMHNKPIFEPDIPKERGENPVVVITVDDRYPIFAEIIKKCQRLNYEYISYKQARLNYIAPDWTLEDLENNIDAAHALEVWDDDASFHIYKHMMRARALKDEDELVDCSPEPQYFVSCVPKHFYRSFLDCGAFNGDTFQQYQKFMNNNFDNYYAVEGDSKNMRQLLENVGNDPRVQIIHSAISDQKKRIVFDNISDGITPKIVKSDETGEVMEADCIDNLMDNKKVTLIKMDIEGAELDALNGAVKTIRKYRPALAISMYHNHGEDMWKVPLWIKEQDIGYSLYCRHHGPFIISETICYAVPHSIR